MDGFDPVSLRLFVAICEAQSLTEAAEREHLTVSAVSKRLLLLEEQIGTPLVERGRGGVQLTAAGEALLPAARGLLQSMARIRANLSEYAHQSRDHVRLSCTPSAISSYVPGDIAAFLAAHPSVYVKLDERMATEVAQRVHEGQADLGIVWDRTGTGSLETVPYRTDRLVVICHAGHPLAERQSVRFTDTLPFNGVTVDAASIAQHLQQRAAIADGRALRSSVCVRTYDGACRIVAANLAIAIVPYRATHSLIAALGLVSIELAEEWALRRFVVCMRDRFGLTASARRLLESLASHWAADEQAEGLRAGGARAGT
jgi:DNA-binding transcriptional LysR family regulator